MHVTLYHHACLKKPTKMIPVFWKQLIFESFRNSFMKGRNCLHLKTSAHKTTAPLAKINLSIMVPDDGQCRGNAFYWLRYYVKMFCRMQWKGHFGSAFLSAKKQRRYFQHFDSLSSQDSKSLVTLTLFIFAASIALIYMYDKPRFLRSRHIYWFTPHNIFVCR